MSVERKWLFTLIQIIFIHVHDSEYRYSVAKKGDFSNNMLQNNRVIFSYYFFNPENLNKSEIANLFMCFFLFLSPVDVTLDPATAAGWVVLSPDNKKVSCNYQLHDS